MKTVGVFVLVIVCGLVAVVGGCGIYVLGSYNNLIRQEQGILASHEDMKNVHASIYNNIKSQGLSVEKYGDMVIKAIDASMTGRYGDGGSKAAISLITEQNPTIDSAVFLKLQAVIEAGYNSFEAKQRDKIDRIRVYRESLLTFPNSLVAGIFGFPRINLDELSKTITTEATEETFRTKKMDTIDPFAR